jgi:hypothetical protein
MRVQYYSQNWKGRGYLGRKRHKWEENIIVKLIYDLEDQESIPGRNMRFFTSPQHPDVF